MTNICYCGAQAGYRHAADCPFTLYSDFPASRVDRWHAERDAIRAATAEAEAKAAEAARKGTARP